MHLSREGVPRGSTAPGFPVCRAGLSFVAGVALHRVISPISHWCIHEVYSDMASKTSTTWLERADERIREILEKIPGGVDGIQALRSNSTPVAEKHEDVMHKTVILRHCQALLDMKGTREARAIRVTDYLIFSGVLEEPVSDIPRWRAGRFTYFRNLGYDKLQAVWAVAEQEGPGTMPKSVLRSLQRFKSSGGTMRGWEDEDFSDLPGLSAEELRRPKSMPEFHQQDK